MTGAKAFACAFALRLVYFNVPPVRDPSGLTLGHLSWMVAEMTEMSANKTQRWLGYIQGVLVARGLATLEEMKTFSRGYAD